LDGELSFILFFACIQFLISASFSELEEVEVCRVFGIYDGKPSVGIVLGELSDRI
jgi:hypothetical protein